MKKYYEAERSIKGDGPAYWVGKKFLENLTGKNQSYINDYNRDAGTAIKFNFLIGANYLTATLAGIDSVLKEYMTKKKDER